MADSALKGIFREIILTYDVEGAGFTTDSDGNQVPNVATAQLVILFEPFQLPQLLYQAGADPVLVRGKCTCMSPALLPVGIGPGTEFDMAYQGHPGKLRVDQVSQEALATLDDTLGQEFRATWRPTP